MSAYSPKTDWHNGQWWMSLGKDGQEVSFDDLLMERVAVRKAVHAVSSKQAALDAATPEGLFDEMPIV